MRLSLRGTWDGRPAPGGLGGDARVLLGDPTVSIEWDVRVPPPPRVPDADPGFHDGLWEHDVVELFLTTSPPDAEAPRYLELEAGPGGHWLALAFDGVRRRSRELRDLAPTLRSELDGGRWRGSLTARLPECGEGPWRGLACLATTDARGERLYLCSQPLPGERADFHRPSAWSRLTAARAASRG